MKVRRVTIADVAREAGVSMMTVSRVINRKGDVSEETAARVMEAIERLGFRPSSIARSLATRRTKTLGLVMPDVANAFFADVARGAEHKAYAEGYSIFLCNTEESVERELAVLASLEEKRVDGLVLCSSRLSDEELAEVLPRFPSVVLVNRTWARDDTLSVIVDDEAGSRVATRHLIATGHRAIGFLVGPPQSFSGRRRMAGYETVLKEEGIDLNPAWIRRCLPMVDAAEVAAQRLLTEHPELDALLCYNDLVAVGALKACRELGRRVPEDLAVVGFDDIPLAELVTPPLTTCRVPRYELGVQAMDLLLRRINGEPIPSPQIVLQPELVIRRSAPNTHAEGAIDS
ncbi:MAG: substrate-binding domain-containing protein [Anaerolineae bacterium]